MQRPISDRLFTGANRFLQLLFQLVFSQFITQHTPVTKSLQVFKLSTVNADVDFALPTIASHTASKVYKSPSYNSIKNWIQAGDSQYPLGPSLHMLAAAEAGVLTLLVTNPIWVVKTRLCLQYGPESSVSSAECYKGMTDALTKIYRTEGVRGLYRGFVPGMFGVTHGALQFMTYEEMKAFYNRSRGLPFDNKLTTGEYLTFAAISKLIAAAATYPYQVIRARLQDQHHSYGGAWDCINKTWKYERMRGFYKGLVPYLLHVTPNICLVMVIYEKFTNNN